MISESANHSNGWVTVRTDGKIQACVNAGPFGNPSDVGTTDVSGATNSHIVALVWDRGGGAWYLYVDDALDASVTGNTLVNGSNTWDLVARFYYGNVDPIASINLDFGLIACWDLPHDATGVATVGAAIRATWGTP
jgi:hypothetical protein